MESLTSKRVCIVGSGNWGSAIAKIVGDTVTKNGTLFESVVKMWVHDEQIGSRMLSDIINTEHENVKYLPGHKLPVNVQAVPNLVEAAVDADVLIFVLPHQFLAKSLAALKGKLKSNAIGVSLVKGVMPSERDGGGILLISDYISSLLDDLPIAVLMGANIASEVANGDVCEATLGTDNSDRKNILKILFNTDSFRIQTCGDKSTVELFGAFKNVVACAVGFVSGLGSGMNTRAMVMRIGILEMLELCKLLSPSFDSETFFQSCGVADLMATCSGGRNFLVSEALAKNGGSLADLEQTMLNGQKLQVNEADLYSKCAKIKYPFNLYIISGPRNCRTNSEMASHQRTLSEVSPFRGCK